jgi:DnaJ-class molecular chaperone
MTKTKDGFELDHSSWPRHIRDSISGGQPSAPQTTTKMHSCPRCEGTGAFILAGDGFECGEVCRPCAGTGQVSAEQWREWCAYLSGASAEARRRCAAGAA